MKYDESVCKFNMDTGCVELLLRDGRKISIDCTGVEDALDVTMAQQTELDYLIYNDPLGYKVIVCRTKIFGRQFFIDLEVLSVPTIQKRWVQQVNLCTGKIKDPLIAHPAQLTGKSTAVHTEEIRQFCPGVGQTVTAFFIGCQGLKINLQTISKPFLC